MHQHIMFNQAVLEKNMGQTVSRHTRASTMCVREPIFFANSVGAVDLCAGEAPVWQTTPQLLDKYSFANSVGAVDFVRQVNGGIAMAAK